MFFHFFKRKQPSIKKTIVGNAQSDLPIVSANAFQQAQIANALLFTMEDNLKKLMHLKSTGFNHPSLDRDIESTNALRCMAFFQVTGRSIEPCAPLPKWRHFSI